MTGLHLSPAGQEVADRVHSIATCAAALDDGRWDATPEIITALADVAEAAARWAMVVELEAAA